MPEGTSQACPACGVKVMLGYAKCPKCHAPMPNATARSRRPSVAGGGGTTSQPIERIDGLGGRGWIVGVVALVVVAGAIIWAVELRGGGETKRPAEAAVPVETGAATATAAPIELQPDELPAPNLQNRPDPAYVADALEGELARDRLFATVDVAGELLDVRSAYCTDPRFSEITARYIADLKASGLVRIRCSETHGEQVYERAL
ncbi:MAG: hypothetical protein F9K40_04170 [Kofleriaceae bacterium]|nr:MAG: hypothetical protein F9K40_04170 [Kofleriaceae bacterium]MBZ0234847.1 hypothetical protein [Kofleriaceae bacterium]